MKELKDYVCTLEQAKKIKELKIEQDSLFIWFSISKNDYQLGYKSQVIQISKLNENNTYAAFTSQELRELLFKIGITEFSVSVIEECSEAQSRAASLIHLLENKNENIK